MQKYQILLAGLFLGVIFNFIFQQHEPVYGNLIELGRNYYEKKDISAPKSNSIVLKLISEFLQTRYAPYVVRLLINDNGVVNLRELSTQIGVPPLDYPIRRLESDEKKSYEREIDMMENGQILDPQWMVGGLRTADSLPTVRDYINAYKSGILPSTVMRRTLQQLREWENQGFRIFTEVIEEDVLRQAFESDKRYQNGSPLSILDGIPIAVKDTLAVKRHHVYNGLNPHEDYSSFWTFSSDDDILVKRFREAGAIILGLTIMTEGGVTPLGYNTHFKGPFSVFGWNRYTGGSSSGSGVAVGSGLVPIAIGFDQGGSIRFPAIMSGLHGLATTFGRCSFEYMLDSSLIKAGPITSNSEDAAIAYSFMSQKEDSHFYSKLYDGGLGGLPSPHLTGFTKIDDLSDVRIGIYSPWFNDSQPHIRDRSYQVVDYLKSKGAKIVEISIPHLAELSLAHGFTISNEFALAYDLAFSSSSTHLEPSTRVTVAIGRVVTGLELLAAGKLKHWAFNYLTGLFKEHSLNAILTPSIGVDVPLFEDASRTYGESDTALSVLLMKHISIVNFLGLPAYTVPIGYLPPDHLHPSEDKSLRLPVGIQLIGDHWTEHKLLRLGHSIEQGFTNNLNERRKNKFFFHPFR